ncbi:MAG: glutathionylspermidine synthase family protein [Tissierellia bacterium]|nr:glutathionylspermidine synthase family protein [Tissierellia bacterium]
MYRKDFDRLQKKEVELGYLYHGKPIPFTYQPLLITETMEEEFKEIVRQTNAIIRKVTTKYLEDATYRSLFGFDERLENLILHDPLYEIPVPIGRYDIFYGGQGEFAFCEINTDGSSAMYEDWAIGELLKDSQVMQDLKDWNFRTYDLFTPWVEKSLALYQSIRGKACRRVAIMDFEELGTPDEFLMFKDCFEAAGVSCEIVDVRNLTFDGSHLLHEGRIIDMVYRRMVTSEMMDRIEEVEPFLEAYLADVMVTIGSFRSQVAHNKIFFEVLHRKETMAFLNDREREFIRRHVPITGKFAGDPSLLEDVIKEKDKYIMKPLDRSAARGVYVGRELSKEEFRKRAERDFNKDYIYQEFVLPKTMDFLSLEEGEWKVIPRGNMMGLFSYMEEFAGIYARMGKEDIIGSIREYVAAPAFRIDEIE